MGQGGGREGTTGEGGGRERTGRGWRGTVDRNWGRRTSLMKPLFHRDMKQTDPTMWMYDHGRRDCPENQKDSPKSDKLRSV